jgi:D-aspartate ligase
MQDADVAEDSRVPVVGTAADPPAFVLGGGVNALAVVRSLGRQGIPVTVFSNDPNDLVRKSRYLASFRRASSDPSELEQGLLELAERTRARPVLLFTADKYLEFISERRKILRECFRFIVSDEKAVSTVLNKGEFNRFTAATGFPAPRGLVVSSASDSPQELDTLRYPVVAKPLMSYEWRSRAFIEKFGTAKAMRFDTSTELRRILPSLLGFTSELLVQEVIVGSDNAHYSVFIYRSPRFGEMFRLCVNKQRVWPIRNGAGSYATVSANAQMESISSELLSRLGWVGMASVCFKVDSRTGQPMIHEVNGRLPQLHGIVQAAGIDLPYLMHRDALEMDLPPQAALSAAATYRILSMDSAALREYRQEGEVSRVGLLKSFLKRDTIAEFARDDIKPGLAVLPGGLSNAVQGFIRGIRRVAPR